MALGLTVHFKNQYCIKSLIFLFHVFGVLIISQCSKHRLNSFIFPIQHVISLLVDTILAIYIHPHCWKTRYQLKFKTYYKTRLKPRISYTVHVALHISPCKFLGQAWLFSTILVLAPVACFSLRL